MKCPKCHKNFTMKQHGPMKLRSEDNFDWCPQCLRKERIKILRERERRLKSLPWYLAMGDCPGNMSALHHCRTNIKTVSRKYAGNQ